MKEAGIQTARKKRDVATGGGLGTGVGGEEEKRGCTGQDRTGQDRTSPGQGKTRQGFWVQGWGE